MKYYAVVTGRNPGIYTDWPTAQKNVSGFPGAKYKSFSTLAEAEDFIKSSTASEVREPLTSSIPDKNIIYTDGSFKNGLGGYGIVVLSYPSDKYEIYGRVPLPPTNNVAELYAIYVALSLVGGDIILYTDSQYAISSLTTYIHSHIKKGWVGVANRELLQSIYPLLSGRSVEFQYVPGHSGYLFNEECDQLAEKGRISGEDQIILKNGEVYS